ncbi:class I SAM-dependent methyltransferase [Leisingera sp. S232]|uniref:class I SAM-dependent methyltransferase n=1 Tax=Leisingera sp. S232 TaxID=3415132 RepID=UPI0008697765|nr:hypothetical protein AB838_05740 [Rhodobacteraceae bacterium (ex Bugula neritina AB1)]
MPDGNVEFYDKCADFYDVLHGERHEEFDFYRHYVPASSHVLEIACGSGTLTDVLLETAASVTGIDASVAMLDRARQRVPGARFIKADMRSFDLGMQFDTVLCPFNSLMHLSPHDSLTALSAFAAHCTDAGQVIIDVSNVDDRFLSPSTPEQIISRFSDVPSGRNLCGWERSEYDRPNRLLSVHWRVEDAETGETVAASSYTQRILSSGELDRLLESAGLRPVDKFGTYGRTPFGPGCPRQLFVAQPLR